MKSLPLVFVMVLFVVGFGFGQTVLASPSTITVPSAQYPTIQSASCGGPIVEIAPGTYNENLVFYQCPYGVTTFRKARGSKGEVVISGGPNADTVKLGFNAVVRFEDITITNEQQLGYYDAAAVYGFGATIEMDNCVVYSSAVGVSSNYAQLTDIANSTFVGWSANAIGVVVTNQSDLGKDQGAHVYNNQFQGLLIGTYHQELVDEVTMPTMTRCKNSTKCGDSNSYYQVASPYIFTTNIAD